MIDILRKRINLLEMELHREKRERLQSEENMSAAYRDCVRDLVESIAAVQESATLPPSASTLPPSAEWTVTESATALPTNQTPQADAITAGAATTSPPATMIATDPYATQFRQLAALYEQAGHSEEDVTSTYDLSDGEDEHIVCETPETHLPADPYPAQFLQLAKLYEAASHAESSDDGADEEQLDERAGEQGASDGPSPTKLLEPMKPKSPSSAMAVFGMS